MRSKVSAVVGLTILSSLVEHALAVNTWELAFHQGIHCTGGAAGSRTGPNKPHGGKVCGNIPAFGYTSACNFLIADGQGYSYYLELYSDENCGGTDLGRYDGNPGGNICIETQSAKSYKVITKKGVKMTRDEESTALESFVSSTADEELTMLPERGITSAIDTLEKRARYTLGLLQFGVSSTALWIYNGAGRCPATANEDNINNTQCGLAATFAVLSFFFSAYQAQGLYRYGAPDARRIKGRNPANLDEILGLPKMNTSLIEGMSISMSSLEPHIDEFGSAWHQYSWEGLDHDNGQVLHVNVRLHPDGRSQAMSAIDDESDSGMTKRANTNAYYSWVGNNKSNFKNVGHGKKAIKQAAAMVWNYGKNNNVAEHCVDFTDYGQSPTRYIDYGSFAIQAGTFTDQSGTCER